MSGIRQTTLKKAFFIAGMIMGHVVILLGPVVGALLGWFHSLWSLVSAVSFFTSLTLYANLVYDRWEGKTHRDTSEDTFPQHRKLRRRWLRIVGSEETGYHLEYKHKWMRVWIQIQRWPYRSEFLTPEEAQEYANRKVDEYIKDEERARQRQKREKRKQQLQKQVVGEFKV